MTTTQDPIAEANRRYYGTGITMTEPTDSDAERLTREQWEEVVRQEQRQRDCAAVTHMPTSIERTESGDPAIGVEATCACGLYAWRPHIVVLEEDPS